MSVEATMEMNGKKYVLKGAEVKYICGKCAFNDDLKSCHYASDACVRASSERLNGTNYYWEEVK